MARGREGAIGAFPLRIGETIVGSLTLVAADETAFDDIECKLLDELAGDIGYGVAHLRIRNRQIEAERTIERMAFQDPLTGSPIGPRCATGSPRRSRPRASGSARWRSCPCTSVISTRSATRSATLPAIG